VSFEQFPNLGLGPPGRGPILFEDPSTAALTSIEAPSSSLDWGKERASESPAEALSFFFTDCVFRYLCAFPTWAGLVPAYLFEF
jgi:hypothetical protein